MRSAPTIRRLGLLGLAAALVGAPVATAGAPTPPQGVRDQIQNPVLLLSLPADGGAWTLWSGTLEGDVWWMLSRPRATDIAGAPCAAARQVLTVCFGGLVGPGRGVAVGRVKPRVAAVAAVDGSGRRLRVMRRGPAYLVVAWGTPSRITVTARARNGDVLARRVVLGDLAR